MAMMNPIKNVGIYVYIHKHTHTLTFAIYR